MVKTQKSRDLELAHKLYQQDHCFGITENAVLPNNKDKENYKPRTLIDQTLEFIDPTPNIHTLFVQFNERFFWNVLLPVEVKWSPRMTSCAGICTFHPKNRQCVISLSAPLLKLRPRKDLVETLLHEMIHGYLFLTNNNRDRDGHGPEFCKHMDRINREAGTRITIYHSFHDEVRLYQQHWWRCNGPCQKKAPYFGTVRRAMNRAPGPSDFWWKEHQLTCGGQFIKIKEPENFKAKSSKTKEKTKLPTKINTSPNSLTAWLTKTTSPAASMKMKVPSDKQDTLPGFIKLGSTTNNVHGWSTAGPGSSKTTKKTNILDRMSATKAIPVATIKKPVSTSPNAKSASAGHNILNGLTKLGNAANNVHGWGTGGPGNSSSTQKHSTLTTKSTTPTFSSSGVLGGSQIGRSNLLDKLYVGSQSHEPRRKIASSAKINNDEIKNLTHNKQSLSEVQMKLVECPICSNFVPNDDINKHVDTCLITNEQKGEIAFKTPTKNSKITPVKSKVNGSNSLFSRKRKTDSASSPSKQPRLEEFQKSKKAHCPLCSKIFDIVDINGHLDVCLLEKNEDNNFNNKSDEIYVESESNNDSIISVSSTSSENSVDHSPTIGQKNKPTHTPSHNCLVCNEFIPPGLSLTDHLEDCIGNVFNDESSLSIDCDNIEALEIQEVSIDDKNKYPCPVCMQLIVDTVMNQHLDVCLSNT